MNELILKVRNYLLFYHYLFACNDCVALKNMLLRSPVSKRTIFVLPKWNNLIIHTHSFFLLLNDFAKQKKTEYFQG